jgi:hypothetical protein
MGAGKILQGIGPTASSLKCGVGKEWGKPADYGEIVIAG